MYPMDENALLPILEVHMKGTKNFLFRSIQEVPSSLMQRTTTHCLQVGELKSD